MAAEKHKIFKLCEVCSGTGVVVEQGVEYTCKHCNGEGKFEWGYVLVPASS